MNTPNDPRQDIDRIRRGRNIALALVLGFFVILVYTISFVKMG